MVTTVKTRVVMGVNVEMVRCARESRMLSRKAVAVLMGISVNSLYAIENGSAHVRHDALLKLADVCHYPTSFFMQKGIPVPFCFLCSESYKLPIAASSCMNARANIVKWQVQSILREVKAKPAKVPVGGEGLSPEAAAGWVRRMWGIPDGPIKNLSALVEAYHVPVCTIDFGNDLAAGRSILTDDRQPIIFINKRCTASAQRLALAKEIGKMLMFGVLGSVYQDISKKATAFSYALLMPADALEASVPSRVSSMDFLEELSTEWQVG